MRTTGVYPPLITPTDGNGKVARDALADHVHELQQQGVEGFFPCGTAGEFTSLTHNQRQVAIETVRNEAPSATVFAGCGGTAVGSVVEQVERAAEIGVEAAVVIAPYYLTPTSAGLRTYFERVIEESSLPIVLYNIPSLTGCTIPVDLVSELAERDRVVGIKDSSGDSRYHRRLIAETPTEFTVLQGITDLAVPSMRAGAGGLVSGVSNVEPEAVIELYEASRRGDYNRALKIHEERLSPLLSALNDVPLAAGLKYILRERGREVGYPMPPLSELLPSDREPIDEWLAATA